MTRKVYSNRSTFDEGVFTAMWNADYTVQRMADEFGCSPQLVSVRAQRLGLPPRRREWYALPADALRAAYAAGYSIAAIRAWLQRRFPGIGEQVVRNAMRRLRVKVSAKGRVRGLPPLGVM